jgi:type I restriction enzyme S subunit
MKLSDYVAFNPRVSLEKGVRANFVSMDAIRPGLRYVYPDQERIVNGSGSRFVPGDILFARITPCLENGKIAQYSGDSNGFGSTEFFVLHAIESSTDPAYLYYFSQKSDLRAAAAKSMTGASGRQRANIDALKEYPCVFPSLREQRSIAAVLTAYDELIDNTLKRIRILEKIAHSIFRDWFVLYRFPGHETQRFTKSPLGRVPTKWSVKKATEAIFVNPKTVVRKRKSIPFVSMSCLSDDSMIIRDGETRSAASGPKFQKGDTLFARITPCLENGKTGFVQFLVGDEPACGSTEFIVLRSKTLCPEYVYLLARTDEFRGNAIKSMTGATGRQRVRESCFDNFLIAHPDTDTLKNFHDCVSPIFHQIYLLFLRNQNLQRTRDLILPCLISGQLGLSQMENPTKS